MLRSSHAIFGLRSPFKNIRASFGRFTSSPSFRGMPRKPDPRTPRERQLLSRVPHRTLFLQACFAAQLQEKSAAARYKRCFLRGALRSGTCRAACKKNALPYRRTGLFFRTLKKRPAARYERFFLREIAARQVPPLPQKQALRFAAPAAFRGTALAP